jgi:hypothetical protein
MSKHAFELNKRFDSQGHLPGKLMMIWSPWGKKRWNLELTAIVNSMPGSRSIGPTASEVFGNIDKILDASACEPNIPDVMLSVTLCTHKIQ